MANPPRKRKNARQELKEILNDLSEEEQKSAEMIEGIFRQLGRAISASIQFAVRPSDHGEEMDEAWEFLADLVVAFAIED